MIEIALHQYLAVAIAVVAATSCQRNDPSESNSATTSKRVYRHRHEANHTPQGPEVLPAPTKRQLRGLVSAVGALEGVDDDMRYVAAISGIAVASSGRVPPQFASDLFTYNGAATRDRARTLLALFDNSAWLFDQVCGQEFESLFAEAQSTRDRGALAKHVWAECRLDRYPLLAGEAEFVAAFEATGPEPMLAYFIFAYLETHGGAHPLETRLLHAIAVGIPPEARLSPEINDWLSAH